MTHCVLVPVPYSIFQILLFMYATSTTTCTVRLIYQCVLCTPSIACTVYDYRYSMLYQELYEPLRELIQHSKPLLVQTTSNGQGTVLRILDRGSWYGTVYCTGNTADVPIQYEVLVRYTVLYRMFIRYQFNRV
jgi:hypothetical protein